MFLVVVITAGVMIAHLVNRRKYCTLFFIYYYHFYCNCIFPKSGHSKINPIRNFLIPRRFDEFFYAPNCLNALQMFCLLNQQMNLCDPNPNKTSSNFNRLESLTKKFCFYALLKCGFGVLQSETCH